MHVQQRKDILGFFDRPKVVLYAEWAKKYYQPMTTEYKYLFLCWLTGSYDDVDASRLWLADDVQRLTLI